MLNVLIVVLWSFAIASVYAADPSYPQRQYTAGLTLLEQGDVAIGKNAWIKYRAYCRLSPEECSREEMEKVDRYFSGLESNRSNEMIVAKPVPVEPPPQSPPEMPITTPKKRRQEKRVKPLADSGRLVKEAERARAQGQLEQALRYYWLAEKIDPEKEDFRTEIGELEKLME